MNTLAERRLLPDIQAGEDQRGVALDEVGISGLRYPATVHCSDGSAQQTICETRLSVALSEPARGAHMSRFVEALHEQCGAVSPENILAMTHDLAMRLHADQAMMRFAFPLFVKREAPVTRKEALLGIDCTLAAHLSTDRTEVRVGARVPVTSLCPCSKEIADYSAHSQRGHVLVEVLDSRWAVGAPGLWPEELLTVCDQAASAPIYPLLKRSDERHVTMLAYDRPAFVEDLAREVALMLKADRRVAGFDLEVINQESIHDHQAFAQLNWRRP